MPNGASRLMLQAFFFDLCLDLFKIHGTTFPTTRGTPRFHLKAFIDKPSHVDHGAQKNRSNQYLLKHDSKVRIQWH